MMLILTGEKECGKTTLLDEVCSGNETKVQGFLSMKNVDNGEVTGISLKILPAGRIFPMATTTPIITKHATSKFYFYTNAFKLVNRHFKRIIKDIPFIFDEFGRLEMRQEGHFCLFEELIETGQPLLVVIRKELLSDFKAAYAQDLDHEILDLDIEERADIINRINTAILDA